MKRKWQIRKENTNKNINGAKNKRKEFFKYDTTAFMHVMVYWEKKMIFLTFT